MGMPISVEIVDAGVTEDAFDRVFDYFTHVDQKFSTYKHESEISQINRKEIKPSEYSEEMQIIFALSQETKQLTNNYFDIQKPDGLFDPSGLVKGWAIYNAAKLLEEMGFANFFVDAGGDIQTRGKNAAGGDWSVGIRNPFTIEQIIKVLYPKGHGVATSGTYLRGRHIYDPLSKKAVESDMVSLTVIGPNIYEADRFATAAFAMGREGIGFIEQLQGFEGYAVDTNGVATMTSGFDRYTHL
jgi:thiamine biosynthesis lipoprotein